MLTSPRLAVVLLLLTAPAAAQLLAMRAWPAGQYATVGATGDLDGDGLVDLALGGDGHMAVLLRDPAGGFLAPLDVPAPEGGTNVTLGHADAGDTLDLVYTTSIAPAAVALRLGDGAGGFGPAVAVVVPLGANGLAFGDFDGDGDDDVAVGSWTTNKVSILLSNGAGGLALSGSVATDLSPQDVRAGDLDEDGDLDLGTPCYGSPRVDLLIGNGAGDFTVTNLPSPALAKNLVLADMDLDGHLDLLLSADSIVALAQGHGDGTFDPWANLGFYGAELHVADVDGNGLPDIVGFQLIISDTVVVRLAQPGGAWMPTPEFESGTAELGGLAILDTDDDGLLDLVFGGMGYYGVGVSRGLGFGEFEHLEKTYFKGDPKDMVTGDFDHDGDADLAVASAGFGAGGGVTTLRNQHAGQFEQEADIGIGMLYDIEAGDVDANGDLDLVSTGPSAGIHVQLGDGTLDYGWAPSIVFGLEEQDSAVGDLDGDGDDDIATCFGEDAAGRLAVFWSDGAGGFAGPFSKQVGVTPDIVRIADLNLDGQLDLVGHAYSPTVLIGDLVHGGALSDPVLTSTYHASDFALGDLDSDGLPEAVINTLDLFQGDATFADYESNGAGGFAAPDLYDAGVHASELLMADMNGDSALDIVAMGSPEDLVGLTLNDGAGALLSPQQYASNGMDDAFTVGDVTGDGYPDVLLAAGSAALSVVESTGPEQPWKYLGQGKAGGLGIPMLVAHGTLQAGEPLTLDLRGAALHSATTVVIGLSPLFAPFKGGALVPQPNLLLGGLVTNPKGQLLLQADWPAGVASGVQLWLQEWVADASASYGLAASNGVTAVAP